MKTLLTLLLIFIFQLTYSQKILFVSEIASGDGSGSTWSNSTTIEEAVKNINSNTEIWIKKGSYKIDKLILISSGLPEEYIDVKLLGGFDGTETNSQQRNYLNNITIFDGQNKTPILHIKTTLTVIDGIQFINGFNNNYNFQTSFKDGAGAITIDSAPSIIRNCYFENNISDVTNSPIASSSGAVALLLGDSRIENSTFINNKSFDNGNIVTQSSGALYIGLRRDPVFIVKSKFENNQSHRNGGAIFAGGSIEITNSEFNNNKSDNFGGAIYAVNSDMYGKITNSIFRNNKSAFGGALNIIFKSEISNTIFIENKATIEGGAIMSSHFTDIKNSLFLNNSAEYYGGAIYNKSRLKITNSNFIGNTNTSIVNNHVDNNVDDFYFTKIYNSIFYNNIKKSENHYADVDNNYGKEKESKFIIDIQTSIMQDYDKGIDNLININPLFVNDENNFELQSNSPAINRGNNNFYNSISNIPANNDIDIINNPRLVSKRIDLGAYEFKHNFDETLPNCPIIIQPIDEKEIKWHPVFNADGYKISFGKTLNFEIENDIDVGNILSYKPTNLEPNAEYHLLVKAYNEKGESNNCSIINFKSFSTCEQVKLSLKITKNEVTVNVSNANQPIQYRIDNGQWTTSNTFTDVSKGLHKIEIQTAEGCIKEILFEIPNFYNFISPNNDGKNDEIDFSFLKLKEKSSVLIVDRFGKTIFKDNGENNFIWKGKQANGMNLPTDTYWYYLEWNEVNSETKNKLQGWILLKNK